MLNDNFQTNGCGKTAYNSWKTVGQAEWLSTLCTEFAKYFTSKVFRLWVIWLVCTRFVQNYTQAFFTNLNLLTAILCTVYTGPINTTKYIKE